MNILDNQRHRRVEGEAPMALPLEGVTLAPLIDPIYKWLKKDLGGVVYWYKGDEEAVDSLVGQIDNLREQTTSAIGEILRRSSGNFGLIAETNDSIIACADKVRAYPLYYSEKGNRVVVSNSARALRAQEKLDEIDAVSRLELKMAGYVTGCETLYRQLYQLLAGELLLIAKPAGTIERKRYYLFYDKRIRSDNEEALIDEFEEINNRMFQGIIRRAKGRPIWVPLSGGLDSRLVLSKLKELGHDNVRSFSYGPPGNEEAKIAEAVAKQAGVRWLFIPSLRKQAKEYFWSEERKKYWEYADGLHVVPNIHWIDSINYLSRKGLLSQDSIFINGQTGDFISGNHIPVYNDAVYNSDLLCHAISSRHFSQMENYYNDRQSLQTVKSKCLQILGELASLDISDHQAFAKVHELWEWQERQSKRVLNGQRTYDYYSFDWELPLWSSEYLDFWPAIPLKLKLHRRLFQNYVKKKDPFGVFNTIPSFVPRWPGKAKSLLYVGKLLRLLCGQNISKKYYKRVDYFSNYSNFYAPFTYREYLKNCQNFRGAISFFTNVYEKEYLT